jgi:hypothetical protein
LNSIWRDSISARLLILINFNIREGHRINSMI